MRWVRDEDGVAAVVIGIMLTTLMLLAAFAVDIGQAREKKRELRTGADAAVLAIAEECGWNPGACTPANAGGIASSYAQANDEDGSAGVSNLQLDPVGKTVSLETFAVDPDSGANGVRTGIAGIIGIDHIEVAADAAAEWGWAASLATLPLVIELCAFENAGAGVVVTLVFFDGSGGGPGNPDECGGGVAGQDAAGTFGWLETTGTCSSLVEYLQWADAEPGQGAGRPPADCDAAELREDLADQVISIPLYDIVRNQGNNTDYHIVGFGAFHVTGYRFGNAAGFRWPNNYACPGGAGQVCMRGYFTTDTVFEGEIGGPNFGVLVVRLTE